MAHGQWAVYVPMDGWVGVDDGASRRRDARYFTTRLSKRNANPKIRMGPPYPGAVEKETLVSTIFRRTDGRTEYPYEAAP
jgi:hypothetical protein